MQFYTYAKTYGNNILYRGYKDGRQVLEKIPYEPTLFLPTHKNSKPTEWKSLYGSRPLEAKKFKSVKDAKKFIDSNDDVEGMELHGFQKFEYQLINEQHPSDIEYDISLVRIHTVDIEVVDETEDGFPDIQDAKVPIVLISLHDSTTDKTIVYGIKEYTKEEGDDFEYRLYENEEKMLMAFIIDQQSSRPDVWTGWNTDGFDIPYLINRIQVLFSEDVVKKLSPFGMIREKIINVRGKDIQTYEIYGLISLDYLELYKKYGTYSAKESYALSFIAQEELGETKLELPGVSFRDNYNNHFQTFVQYNAIDSILIKKMEKKMKLIELAFSMAYMYHCNLQDIYRTVLPWEVFIYNFLAKKKIAVPPRKNANVREFEGAWVKEPKAGMYGWTMAFDFASLYPHVEIQWNISPETFVPARYNVDVHQFLEGSEESFKAIEYAVENNMTIAANGTMYRKDVVGFFPEMMKFCVYGRKAAKKEMLALESEYQKTHDESLLPKIAALNNKQMALKIAANAAYGAMSNKGFHYYDYRIAEAITLSGQLSDIHLAGKLNNKFNSLLKTTGVDYVIYGDTDSIYLNCQPIVEKFANFDDRAKVVKFLDKFGEGVCQPVVNQSVQEVFEKMNCLEKVMASKREAIASRVLFRKKKNYAMYVHNSEGVDYNPPKLKVLGIEIVRSSTPQWCRKKLKESLMMIFETDEASFRKHFEKLEKEFKTLRPDEIAFPRGVSDIDKWLAGGTILKGCPIHVRASIVYNKNIKHFESYPQIQNGDKIKFLYLRMPNQIRQNVIGMPTGMKLPSELKLDKYVDYTLQFEKTFEEPLKTLTDCAGWDLRERSTLESFYN